MDDEERMEEEQPSTSEETAEPNVSQDDINAENNENAVRAAAAGLKDAGIPYASAVAQGVDVADKVTGGRSTRAIGRGMNEINKRTPGGELAQGSINRLNQSGAIDATNRRRGILGKKRGSTTSSASRSNEDGSKYGGDFEMKINIPPKVKIILWIVAICAIFILMLFVAIFGSEESNGGSGIGGSLEYGENCTDVVVQNTGCDANGENCTLIYDGKISVEKYVAGVVAANTVQSSNLEYYKTMAISTRTYFYENVNEECTVEGNNDFLNYIDVQDSPNASLIQQAVDETKSDVLVKENKLISLKYSYGYIEAEDNDYYYIGYGYNTMEEVQTQQIPKTWVSQKGLTNQLTQSKDKEYDISVIGAMYLIENNGYNYKNIISHYFGSEAQVVKNHMILRGNGGFINPTRKVYCTSPFGTRIHPVSGKQEYHSGLDIGIPGGEPVYAAQDGTVRYVVKNVSAINNCSFGYGNYIIIDHANGLSTLYAHLKYDTIPSEIVAGAEVNQGDQIGGVGSTGCSTGNHLHYEVSLNGSRVDPTDYMDLSQAAGECKR